MAVFGTEQRRPAQERVCQLNLNRANISGGSCAALVAAALLVTSCTAAAAATAPRKRAPAARRRSALSWCSRPACRWSPSLPGRTNAFQTSEVRPQVSGIIQRRFFTEGSYRPRRARRSTRSIPASISAGVRPGVGQSRQRARATAEAARIKAERYARSPRCRRSASRIIPTPPPQARQAAARGRAEPRRARHRADQPALHHASPRRSAAGSGARCSPKARWSPPTRPIRSR